MKAVGFFLVGVFALIGCAGILGEDELPGPAPAVVDAGASDAADQ